MWAFPSFLLPTQVLKCYCVGSSQQIGPHHNLTLGQGPSMKLHFFPPHPLTPIVSFFPHTLFQPNSYLLPFSSLFLYAFLFPFIIFSLFFLFYLVFCLLDFYFFLCFCFPCVCVKEDELYSSKSLLGCIMFLVLVDHKKRTQQQ